MPSPGGPKQVYDMFDKQYEVTHGPEGLYMHPTRTPAGAGMLWRRRYDRISH